MSLEKYIFNAPVKFDFRVGVSAKAGTEVKNIGCKKPIIITDEGIKKSGILDKIKNLLDVEGISSVVYLKSKSQSNYREFWRSL